MTAQISDTVKYRNTSYSIAGISGKGLFEPHANGIRPGYKCTACLRGFVCTYAVDGGRLLLDELAVCLDGPAPRLFGVSPKPDVSDIQLFDATYAVLNHPVPYDGRLLLAADFIPELYIHGGFHPAWKYHEVHQLVFHAGELRSEMDVSVQIAEIRRAASDRPRGPGGWAHRADGARWVEQCFGKEYRW